MIIFRWLVIFAFFGFAWKRKSLTTWILVAMVAGAEIGHDWPDAAIKFRLLSLIFLNLIKTIIAPLLFGTLVVGIAGHSNLRQVGRMGVKALIYKTAPGRDLGPGWQPLVAGFYVYLVPPR